MKPKQQKKPHKKSPHFAIDENHITHTTNDFRTVKDTIKIGIICNGLVDENVFVTKFDKLLNKLKNHEDYYYRTVFISNIITVKSRRSGDIRII